MIFNYLKIAWRSLKVNKLFSALNILGLSLGIICFLTLALFVLDELNYDSFHANADRICRVYVHSNINGQETNNSKSAAPLGASLLKDIPEVMSYTRIGYFGQHILQYSDKTFRERSIYTVDSTYFSVFSFPFVYGNPKTALNGPNQVVLTETTAAKYFGTVNPVGKTLLVDGNSSYLVTGVMKDFPEKSHFRCDFLLSMATYTKEANTDYWLGLDYTTYILLKAGVNVSQFETKLKQIITTYVKPQAEKLLGIPFDNFLARGNAYELKVQPLTSIYLYSQATYGIDTNTEWGAMKFGDITYVYIFGIVALFILLIAVINFMNLSTARSEKRAKEVGIKKTLGSDRKSIIQQFITESVLITFFAVVLALALLQITLPLFNLLIDRHLTLNLVENLYAVPALLLFTLAVGALAGSYPAFFLSSFKPIDIFLKTTLKRKIGFRSALVVVQFSISAALIIGMIVVKSQLNHIQEQNLGFKKEYLLSIDNANALGKQISAFKQELLKSPHIEAATNSSLIFSSGVPGKGFLFDKKATTDPVLLQALDIDTDFLKTFGLQLKEGRFFSKDFPTDSAAIIINEAALKELPSRSVLNKTLTVINNQNQPETYTIIGVIKDFNYESLHREIRPLAFHLSAVRQASSLLTVRLRAGNPDAALAHLEKTWKLFAKGETCRYGFMDENLERLYATERKVNIIATLFSAWAIFIACLGLFGLAVLIAEQKTKEIGIRKVLGASLAELVFTISKPFLGWIVVANLIAWPITYFAMTNWLQHFAYRIEIRWWMFVIASFFTLLIAFATISSQSIKTALRNPVKALKSE
ncbi:ABC transporter permease [Runella sp. MFBS21]|uniref:ABC transporter permease n=1 Tax=Runella sp. MFBS21 TaxID=3034018 RepID=UPI0023F6ACE4|nr:ABC transporter permease [Runella sp. MFBS21]MDF7815994.1 ABC transporter permease [Runella sp. MFBS21]